MAVGNEPRQSCTHRENCQGGQQTIRHSQTTPVIARPVILSGHDPHYAGRDARPRGSRSNHLWRADLCGPRSDPPRIRCPCESVNLNWSRDDGSVRPRLMTASRRPRQRSGSAPHAPSAPSARNTPCPALTPAAGSAPVSGAAPRRESALSCAVSRRRRQHDDHDPGPQAPAGERGMASGRQRATRSAQATSPFSG